MRADLGRDPLSIVTVCASAVISLYYTVYLILCLIGLDSRLMCLFALFVIACVSLPILHAVRLRTKLGKAFRGCQIIFTVMMLVYILTVIFFWCYIGFDAAHTPEAFIEATEGTGEDLLVLVFGCRTYGYTPSLTLENRLEAAYKLLAAFPDAVCIVSGGQGTNETISEALSMKSYLEGKGIDGDRIHMEQESHSTSENVRHSRDLIETLELTDKTIVGVSTSFHLPRIDMLSKRYGLPMQLCSSSSPSVGHHYVSMIREYLSYIKMMLFDEAVLITQIT